MTAPIAARGMATFSPTKICGSAAGNRTFRNACQREASSERANSARSAGVDVRPVAVDSTIGKKQSRKTMVRTGFCPQPRAPTNSGPSAIFGTALTATSSGVNIRSSTREPASDSPIRTPQPLERTNPTTVSTVVSPACFRNRTGAAANAESTAPGGGSTAGWITSSTEVRSHHTPSATRSPAKGSSTTPMPVLRREPTRGTGTGTGSGPAAEACCGFESSVIPSFSQRGPSPARRDQAFGTRSKSMICAGVIPAAARPLAPGLRCSSRPARSPASRVPCRNRPA